VGSTSYLSNGSGEVGAPPRDARRSGGWGVPDDDDNPIGTVTNVPVSEPFVLLLMALLYIVGMRLRIRFSRQTPR
jgi:hypothetical protein